MRGMTMRGFAAIPLALGLALASTSPALATEGAAEEGEHEVQITIDCEKNLAFSRYDLNVYVDDELVANIDHGTEETIELTLADGTHTLSVEQEDDASVDGHAKFDVSGDVALGYDVKCTSDQVEVELAESSGTARTASKAAQGASSSTVDAATSASADATTDVTPVPQAFAAEPTPQGLAERAVVVAMTNRNATDVFTDDGSAYDPAKFHAYGDLAGYYLEIDEEGTWAQTGDNAWHVDGMLLASNLDSYAKVSCDVTFDGAQYVLSNVDGYVGNLQAVTSGDAGQAERVEEQPTEFTSYLTVSAEQVAQGRETEQAQAEAAAAAATPAETTAPAEASPAEVVEAIVEEVAQTDIRPEFQAAMDSYEAFFDEYVAFMQSYDSSDTSLETLTSYLDLMGRYTETMEALDAIDEDSLTDAEALYYAEVSARISEKLLSVGQ